MLLLPLGYSLLMEIHSKDFSQLCPAVWPATANIQNKYTCIYERRALLYRLQTENNHKIHEIYRNSKSVSLDIF